MASVSRAAFYAFALAFSAFLLYPLYVLFLIAFSPAKFTVVALAKMTNIRMDLLRAGCGVRPCLRPCGE